MQRGQVVEESLHLLGVESCLGDPASLRTKAIAVAPEYAVAVKADVGGVLVEHRTGDQSFAVESHHVVAGEDLRFRDVFSLFRLARVVSRTMAWKSRCCCDVKAAVTGSWLSQFRGQEDGEELAGLARLPQSRPFALWSPRRESVRANSWAIIVLGKLLQKAKEALADIDLDLMMLMTAAGTVLAAGVVFGVTQIARMIEQGRRERTRECFLVRPRATCSQVRLFRTLKKES